MELAIEVMRKSVYEPRKDDKASPLVGVVLYKPDGTVETACRGELRYGDHAEYTILERKNRSIRLDNSVLFSTLEPCAPGSRRHPKLSCAERIVFARIKEVWVGLEDPDPTVDRKGIKYLQDSGITVHMFDRDLQEVIQNENKDFIAQALERATAVKEEKPKKITLSTLEGKFAATVIDDFSAEALEHYRSITKIKDNVGSDSFNRRLVQQGLLEQEGERYIPTGFGLLLFGKEPRATMPQAGLLAAIHYPNGDQERKEFDEPAVMIPDLIEKWLRDKLPNIFDRNMMQRKERPALPFEMLREAVVNALIHRDYAIEGGKCQVVVTENTITVKSPGEPPAPITVEQLQAFTAPMLSRNPELHFVFARMGMAEEQGLGIGSLRDKAKELGLPLPRYTWEAPYLVLTLYRTPESATSELPDDVARKLNADEKATWQFVVSRESINSAEVMEHLEFDERKTQRMLKKLMDRKLIRRIGKGPATRYEVIRQSRQR